MARNQDYLVNRNEKPERDENKAIKLSAGNIQAPSVNVSNTGGQRNRKEPQQPRNESRRRNKARKRQIRENRPVDLRLQDTAETEAEIQSDLYGQFNQQEEKVRERAPKVDDFLPDLNKAIEGDQKALQATGERLQGEYKPVDTQPLRASQTAFDDYLKQPSMEAYQSELAKQRGGTFGINALDAAILDASGAGRQAFDDARERVIEAKQSTAPFEQRLENIQRSYKDQYRKGRDDLKGTLASMEDAYNQMIGQRRKEYAGRDDIYEKISSAEPSYERMQDLSNREFSEPTLRDLLIAREEYPEQFDTPLYNEIFDTFREAREKAPSKLDPYIVGRNFDYKPFVDREMSKAEALGSDNVAKYNRIQELLGGQPLVPREERDPQLRREAMINALIEGAREAEFERAQEEKRLEEARRREEERLSRDVLDEQIEAPPPSRGPDGPVRPFGWARRG